MHNEYCMTIALEYSAPSITALSSISIAITNINSKVKQHLLE